MISLYKNDRHQLVRFSQNSINNTFRDGSLIDDLATALRKGTPL